MHKQIITHVKNVKMSNLNPTYNPLLVAEVRNYLDIIEFIRRDKTRHNCGKELIDCYPIRRIIWRDSSTG